MTQLLERMFRAKMTIRFPSISLKSIFFSLLRLFLLEKSHDQEVFWYISTDASRTIERWMNKNVLGIVWLFYAGYAIANICAIAGETDEFTAFLIPVVTNGLHLGFLALGAVLATDSVESSSRNVWPATPCDCFLRVVDFVLLIVFILSIVFLAEAVDPDNPRFWIVLVNGLSLFGVLVCFYKTYYLYHQKSGNPVSFQILVSE